MNKDKESLARLQHHIESLLRAETLIAPALSWVEELATQKRQNGLLCRPQAEWMGSECLKRLVQFRRLLELDARRLGKEADRFAGGDA